MSQGSEFRGSTVPACVRFGPLVLHVQMGEHTPRTGVCGIRKMSTLAGSLERRFQASLSSHCLLLFTKCLLFSFCLTAGFPDSSMQTQCQIPAVGEWCYSYGFKMLWWEQTCAYRFCYGKKPTGNFTNLQLAVLHRKWRLAYKKGFQDSGSSICYAQL